LDNYLAEVHWFVFVPSCIFYVYRFSPFHRRMYTPLHRGPQKRVTGSWDSHAILLTSRNSQK